MDSPLAVYRDVGLLRGVEVAVVPSLRVVVVLHNKMDAHVKISIQVRVHVQVHLHCICIYMYMYMYCTRT